MLCSGDGTGGGDASKGGVVGVRVVGGSVGMGGWVVMGGGWSSGDRGGSCGKVRSMQMGGVFVEVFRRLQLSWVV